jgi:uncharacterized protein YycO
MIRDKGNRQVFDSLPDDGVQTRTFDATTYTKIVAYGTKSVDSPWLFRYSALDAIESAIARFRRTPYFPTVGKNYASLDFYRQWSDKHDTSSMYCSKLVWRTFYDYFGIDLDSDRTKCYVSRLKNRDGSWIGVSPDDIWGSNDTSEWWDLSQEGQLSYGRLR